MPTAVRFILRLATNCKILNMVTRFPARNLCTCIFARACPDAGSTRERWRRIEIILLRRSQGFHAALEVPRSAPAAVSNFFG